MEGIGQIVILGGFFAVMYFLLIRPQRKRQQEQEKLLASLVIGDPVVTIGGMHGVIVHLDEQTVDLAVAEDEAGEDVVLRFQRSSVARVVAVEPDDDVDELLAEDDTRDEA